MVSTGYEPNHDPNFLAMRIVEAQPSTGYEPTTNNTLLAAVTNVVGDMDVDIPYGGGTGSSGGLAIMAPTTPPLTPPQANQSILLPQ